MEGELVSTNNHWGASGNVPSPVTISGNVWVSDSLTLTIDPGTEIRFGGSFSLVVHDNAKVHAIGRPEAWISFGSTSPGAMIDLGGDAEAVFAFTHIENCNRVGAGRNAEMTMRNSIIYNCSIGLGITGGEFIKIENCTFAKCNPPVVMSGIPSTFSFRNNIFYHSEGISFSCNDLRLNYDNIVFNARFGPYDSYDSCGSTLGPGEFRLTESPFVDLRNGDLRIKPTSPTIDAGDPSSDYSLEPDCNGKNTRINIGAYGNTPEAACKEDIGVVMPLVRGNPKSPSERTVMYDIRGRRIYPTGFSAGVRIIQTEGAARASRAEVHFQTVGAGQ